MFEPVYISMDTEPNSCFPIDVTPAHIGIKKRTGCVQFFPADGVTMDSLGLSMCEAKYGSVPNPGEVWLVEEGRKYINWTRIDHNLHLLDIYDNIIRDKT